MPLPLLQGVVCPTVIIRIAPEEGNATSSPTNGRGCLYATIIIRIAPLERHATSSHYQPKKMNVLYFYLVFWG